jgi:hypothetical protein
MGKINYGRVLLGGLLAGVVLNLGEMLLNMQIVSDDWDAALQAIGKGPISSDAVAIFIVLMFALGILAVWVYAAIRPRFGPGPKTAVCAGLVVWALTYAWPALSGIPMDVFPAWLFIISMIWGLFEVPLATLAGAWFYKES